MTTLIQQIEETRIRMSELRGNEQGLIESLGDALSRADQKLLQDVRNLATEHEERRGAIPEELRALASRLGSFPQSREPTGTHKNAASELPSYETPRPTSGDWRLSTTNIGVAFAGRRVSGW